MNGLYYRYTEGFRSRGTPAGVVYEEIARIEDECGGTATNAQIFEAAKPEESPIHQEFVWDGTAAIRELGIHRAGQLRRAIEVVYTNKPKRAPSRVWVHVMADEKTGKGPYRRIDDVVKHQNEFRMALNGLRRQFDGLARSIRELEDAAKRSGNEAALLRMRPMVDAVVMARQSIPDLEKH